MSPCHPFFERLYLWVTRCIPGLMTCTFVSFVALCLIDSRKHVVYYHRHPDAWPTPAQLFFISYGIILHLFALAFPIRLCHAAWSITGEILQDQSSSAVRDSLQAPEVVDEKESKETLVSFDMVKGEVTTPEIIHAIMVPSYKEDISTLEDTLKVLASHTAAPKQYHIVLAMESRDSNAEKTAAVLHERFQACFYRIEHTLHPGDIPGEAAGKSSNVSWAAKHLQQVYTGTFAFKNVILTVMDCDTHLLPMYFDRIATIHQTKRGVPTLYCPPCIFDRNANMVPPMVRMADLMWSGALLSMFSKNATVVIPTAVYSMALPVAAQTGGWDSGPEAIGEDMHMALKTYFASNGKINFEIIPCPASQCNVGGDARGIRGFFKAHDARYKQGLRHMWGSLDTGFAVRRFINMGHAPPSTSPYTRPRKASETEIDFRLSQMDVPSSRHLRLTYRNLILFTRLFEAHILPVHLTATLLASTIWQILVPAADRSTAMVFFLNLTAVMRTISFCIMILFFSVYYERFHATCINAREAAMKKAGLYEQLQDQFAYRSQLKIQKWIDYFIFPIAGMIFGSLAAVQATFSHFWTDRLVYVVSQKPLLERMAVKLEAAVGV